MLTRYWAWTVWERIY